MRQIFLPADNLSPVVFALPCLGNVLGGICNNDGKQAFQLLFSPACHWKGGKNTPDLGQASLPSEMQDLPSRKQFKVKFKRGGKKKKEGKEMYENDKGKVTAKMNNSRGHMKKQERDFVTLEK